MGEIRFKNLPKLLSSMEKKEWVINSFLFNYKKRGLCCNIKVIFSSVDDFVIMANQVLNRRKSQAGKSLEHHLAAIFDENKIRYTAQAVTEGNKKPDFLFPSEEAYHDMIFSVENLCTLAAKTTCKDRWRQILNEADRLRDENKYLNL